MNRKKFHKSLNALTSWRESAFILALAERAFPNVLLYFHSVEDEAAASAPVVSYKLIDRTWSHLIDNPNEEGMVALLDKTMDLVSLTEGVEHYGALPTRDCLRILEQALLSGINAEKKRALEASQLSLNTITDFIEFSEGEGLSENQIIKLFDTHPLVEREFSFQQELSDMLRSATHPGKDFIAQVRALAHDDGVSNIGISL